MSEPHVRIWRASNPTPELEDLFARARHDAHAKRGGSALLTTLCDGEDEASLLERLLAASALYCVAADHELRGFAVVRHGVIETLYVAHDHRRHGVATAMVRHLLEGTDAPVDAYALPGDRAMKSLYESLGWKARLLTMRGA